MKFYLYIAAAFLIFITGCSEEKREEIFQPPVETAPEPEPEPELEINFYDLPVEGISTLKYLRENYGDEGLYLILAINRLDVKNVRTGDTLVVPDTLILDRFVYSPFPLILEAAADIPKILFFSHRIQAFAAYERGELVNWGPTSLGKKSTPTPSDLYFTTWKARSTISTVNPEWILPWAFNIDNFRGISLHEYALPGYPASHACARLLEKDAQWIYYWAEQWILTRDERTVLAHGTPVIIFGEYEFGKKPVWKKLSAEPNITEITVKDLENELAEYSERILNKKEIRESLLAEREAAREEGLKN
jgi:hypothetical protein